MRLPILRRLVPSIEKRIGALTWPGSFKVVRSNGAVFLVSYRNYVDRQIAFRGDYEAAQHEFFLGKMRDCACDIFIDVGANIGLYTVLAALEAKPARIVAFEPDPRNYDQLRANLLLNRLTFGVETHKLAVSDRSTVDFRLGSETSTGESKVATGHPDSMSLPAVRLDDFLPVRGATLFIKIDIEGHEASALAGMEMLLRNNRCFLQIESFDANFPAVDAFLRGAGYDLRRQLDADRYFANF